jgi:hypothetical protein
VYFVQFGVFNQFTSPTVTRKLSVSLCVFRAPFIHDGANLSRHGVSLFRHGVVTTRHGDIIYALWG